MSDPPTSEERLKARMQEGPPPLPETVDPTHYKSRKWSRDLADYAPMGGSQPPKIAVRPSPHEDGLPAMVICVIGKDFWGDAFYEDAVETAIERARTIAEKLGLEYVD